MPNQKHLDLDDRSIIHSELNAGHSFRKIALTLDKDPGTIAKEVRKYRKLTQIGAYGRVSNRCIHRKTCQRENVCDRADCNRRLCRSCKHCNHSCDQFVEDLCPLLGKPPFVCNGCEQRRNCTLSKYFYKADTAQAVYRESLSASRKGCSYTVEELAQINAVIAPGLQKNQSPHHVFANHRDQLLCSERTLYRLIDQGLLEVINLDLPCKVRYRPRKKGQPLKIERQCRLGRSYKDFIAYLLDNPELPVVEMDSVIGQKGGKVFLTLYFRQSCLMPIFLRDRNDAHSVTAIFNALDAALGRDLFMRLFPVILTDNGSEFSNPSAIEFDQNGQRRTRIFYCDPGKPEQKPGIEGNHPLIRRILPSGVSFNLLTPPDVLLIVGHLNALTRKKLNDLPPTAAFSFFFGGDALRLLGIPIVPPDEVNLSTRLLRLPREDSQIGKII